MSVDGSSLLPFFGSHLPLMGLGRRRPLDGTILGLGWWRGWWGGQGKVVFGVKGGDGTVGAVAV